MLTLSNHVILTDKDIEISAIRAQGAGGQNVNKLSSAIHLRLDIHKASLPAFYKQRLLALNDQRLSKDGVIVIKSQAFRSQEQNKQAALERLKTLIEDAVRPVKKRKATRPTRASQRKRLDGKTRDKRTKALRAKVTRSD